MNQEERELANQKVFIDDLNQVRLVNPALLESSTKLATESKQFFGQFEQFLATICQVREAMEKLGRITDRERMKLLSLKNQLDQREDLASEEAKQIQSLINERQRELERLRVELESLKQVEAQQIEYLLQCKKI